jgi:hypothetical protein
VPAILAVVLVGSLAAPAAARGGLGQGRKKDIPDRFGGLPGKILQLQSSEKVEPPTLDAAIMAALDAAREAAQPLIDGRWHKGRHLRVPDGFKTIQTALDAAKAGDIVVVAAGTYFEQLVMKDGVRLTSDPAEGGDQLVAVPGAHLKLPLRTLRTVLDGSNSEASHRGMVDFDPGLGRHTIVDGFTIRNLPRQDHHVPGHAHGINVRGASPVVLNCYIHDNGSTGVGNHVVYRDQKLPIGRRDFRWANVAHKTEAVLYNNALCRSLGLGIGCNHFSAPVLLGNEIFANSDAALGQPPTPGIGAKHGAAPVIIGNLVHDNPGGGILSRSGVPQGAHPIDRRTRPWVLKNVAYANGDSRPAISSKGCGTRRDPVRIEGNVVLGSGGVGIGLSEEAVGVVVGNRVCRSGASGIAIHGSTALRLNGNRVTEARAPGFVLVSGARVLEMVDNASDANQGPGYMVAGATIGNPAGKGQGR